MKNKIKPWTELKSESVYSARVFELRKKLMRSSDGTIEDDFYYIKSNDWVQVIPITEDNKVVMVEQYRHGVDLVTLELPGGLVDPGEDPMETAKRELTEETAYVADELIQIGWSHPNPAIQTNSSFCYLAKNVKPCGKQNFDLHEEIHLHLVPLEKIPELIKQGKISHAIMLCAFYFLENWEREN